MLSLSVKSQPHKWHIWFLPTHEPTLKKPKEPFFSNARQPSENNLLLLTKFRQVQNKTMTLGQKIRELREQAGLKQRELAYQLGIGEGFLSKVENDQKPLKREDLTKLNELFKTPIEELESLWLANKVYSIVRDEETALSALKVAEEQITYNTLRNGK
ncbi:helix-turn-helix domain-containing protein [Empedobacter falsenii]|uniref:helix-turn-helix domain-containing protein n=1 Tax=Empedobacter falsenii TaxID=343874 RepID=UPI0021A97EFB|nr:helix-turn-helix transcriptional regulator [Empedobacter falsenii]